MAKTSQEAFRFRRTDSIGAASAEEDEQFLLSCFVDTGDLGLLEAVDSPRLIVLGRTGSGKSALLSRIRERHPERTIVINPENLALTYVSNSTILNYFSGLGVNLDPFFKLLWRHVLIVEILIRHFGPNKPSEQVSLLDRIMAAVGGKDARKTQEIHDAIAYLQTWGKSFWSETEFRVKEITSNLERDLNDAFSGELKLAIGSLQSGSKEVQKLSEETKAEVISRAQEIVSKAQVQDLSKIMGLLDGVLSDRQKSYYVVIDRLDENWVEERLRYKLIMALIVTARDFIHVRHSKVIVALRRDLIERVFRIARDSGFQEEKYQSLYVPLEWSKKELLELLDRRIGELVSQRYTKQAVTHRDFLPRSYNGVPISDYITRIAWRPRDVIALFNTCILAGTNCSRLKVQDFQKAEGEYSRGRLRALADEWSADYPGLLDYAQILSRRTASFKLGTVDDTDVSELCLRIASDPTPPNGLIDIQAGLLLACRTEPADFKVFLFQVFYKIGLVGLKLQPHEAESWVDELGRSISAAEVSNDTSVVIHPAYHRALGIRQ